MKSLEEAINRLELSDAANADMERSMLDAAIYISFMILEMTLYLRIIEGKDIQPITKKEAHDIENSKWDKFTQNATILKYLGSINALENL